MKMQEGNNYQPAMIKLLINVGGTVSKSQILQGLEEENPERKIKKDSVNTVAEVLTNHNVVKNNADSTFTLLDYESYSNTERQHIVDLCNKKIIEASSYSSERQNRIVLFSVSGEDSFEHFKETILNDVDTLTFTRAEMKKFPKVRTWGSINNKYTYPKWEKLKKGDIILFYRDKKYVTVGILEGTEHNQQVAQSMWGTKGDTGLTWELIMYMLPENVIESNVNFQKLNNLLDYKENFMPTRTLDFTLVRSDVIRDLNNKFESTENALASIGFNLTNELNYKNIEKTNYLSLENFEDFLNVIPKLAVYHGSARSKAVLSPEMMQLLFKVTYYCALRISETLSLRKNDIDLESKILTIRESKSATTQKTTIPPKLVKDLKKVLDKLPDVPFNVSRQTIWDYSKKAGQLAGLNIFESQQNRDIEGIWPTIFRQSRAKEMETKGANDGLIRLKLRLSYDDAVFKTDRPSIEELIEWEANEESIMGNLSEDIVNYWKISPGENGSDWKNQREKGLIGISFFDFGDLSKLSEEQLREKIRQAYGKELTPAKQANTFGQMRDFMKIKEGDIVVTNSGKSKILGIGRVEGPYHYRKGARYPHTFPVDWYDTTEGVIPKQESWMITVIPLSKQEYDELMKFKTNYLLLRFKIDGKTQWTDEFGKSYHYGEIANYTKIVKGSQVILYDKQDGRYLFLGYGDVGTIRDEMHGGDSWAEMETFEKFNPPKHGAVELENKITNLPNFNNQHSILPITKEIYDEIINEKEQIQEMETFENKPLIFPKEGYKVAKEKIQKELLIKEEIIDQIVVSLYSGKNVILTGPVGTGKTHLAQLIPKIIWEKIGGYYPETVTATSEWTTQDVIGGIFPKVDKNEIKYIIQKGCVAETVSKNWQDGTGKSGKRQKFEKDGVEYNGIWLVIDEFNRANIDRAFGPLFTALEYKKLKIPTTDPNESFEELIIPEDYRIIGTLNTFDKHFLFRLSDALKRRFSFIEILPPSYDKILEEIRFVSEKALEGYDDIKQELNIKTFDDLRKNESVYKLLSNLYDLMAFVRMSKNLGTAVLISMFRFALINYLTTKNPDQCLDTAAVTNLLPHLESLQYWQIDSIMNFVRGRIHEMFRKFDVNKRPDVDRYEEQLRNLTKYLRVSGTNKAAGDWISKFRNGEIMKLQNIPDLDPWTTKHRPRLPKFGQALESLKIEKGYFEESEEFSE